MVSFAVTGNERTNEKHPLPLDTNIRTHIMAHWTPWGGPLVPYHGDQWAISHAVRHRFTKKSQLQPGA